MSTASGRSDAVGLMAGLPVLAWLLAATALGLVRQPGTPSWDSMWQEDGGIFLTDALREPFASTLLEPYNSYLHLVPRLLAGAIAPLPVDGAALALALAASLTVALVSLYVFWAGEPLLGSPWARGLLAALVVVVPAAGYETTANVANLHWYLIFAAFWALASPPTSRRRLAVATLVVALAVLSDPLAGLLLPLAAWQALRHRAAGGAVLAAVFAACLAVQLALGAAGEAPDRYIDSDWRDLPGIYALRVTGSLLVGDRFLEHGWLALGYGFAATAAVVLLGAWGWGFARAGSGDRALLAACLAYSVAFLAVPLLLRGTEGFLSSVDFSLNGSRYTLLPVLFLVTGLILVVDRLEPAAAPLADSPVRLSATFLVAAVVLANFSVTSVRSPGPSWAAGLAEARRTCLRHGGRPPPVPSIPDRGFTSQAHVVIAPKVDPPAFAVSLDCRRL